MVQSPSDVKEKVEILEVVLTGIKVWVLGGLPPKLLNPDRSLKTTLVHFITLYKIKNLLSQS